MPAFSNAFLFTAVDKVELLEEIVENTKNNNAAAYPVSERDGFMILT